MAFNVGISSKDAFKELKKLSPQKRVDAVKYEGAATVLTMLTPAEFAELFPKYYQKGLPDVGGFREAVSRQSRSRQEGINRQVLESAGGKTTIADQPISNRVLAKDIYNYLRTTHHVDHVHAMGILASIQGESRFDSGALNPDDRGGPSGGLFQFHDVGFGGKGRFSQMKAFVGEGWQTNWKKQIDYAMTESGMKLYLSHSFADEKDAVRGFVYDFEKPLDKEGDTATRQSYLRSISSAISGTGDSLEGQEVSKVSSKSGGFYGNDEQCVALSKHFSGLGAASGWRVKSGSITAGTVIATMSYNDGSGGKMAKDMPDGKSHYHTGIALTAPNANGEVLILEQFAGQPARVRSININNYNGERWGVVEGGDPSARTMQAVEVGKSLANQDQLAWIQSSSGMQTGEGGKPSVDVKPTQQAGVAKPTLTTNDQAPQYPEQQQQQATEQSAKVEKPDKAKKTYQTFKFDPNSYYEEVNSKHPEAKFFGYDKDRIMKETYEGFAEAQAAGAIKWNRKTNEIQVLDPNHEALQKIYKDMQDQNIDRSKFLTQSEAGGSGSAKVGKVKRQKPVHAGGGEVADRYDPDVSSSGLNKSSNLLDYRSSQAAESIGVSQEQYNAFREAVASIESRGGVYTLRGGSSNRFTGAYQMGGDEIKEVAERLGEEPPVMKVKGQRKPVGNDQFLNSPEMQERYFDAYIALHHERLMKNKKYAAMSPEERLKIHGMAHNKGAGAASSYLRTGKIGTDAFGTHPEKYAIRIGKQLDKMQAQQDKELSEKVQVAASPTEELVATPGTQPTVTPEQQPTPPGKSVADRAKEFLGISATTAGEQHERARTVFERMRQIPKPTQPAVEQPVVVPTQKPSPQHIRTNITPSTSKDIDEFLMKHPINPQNQQPAPQMEHQSMSLPSDKPQSPVIVDSFMKQGTTGFPSPSLERAMNNTRGIQESSANRIGTGTSIA